MYRLLLIFLFLSPFGFSQNSKSPEWFKGEHFVIYNKCKTAVIFCENTQQNYSFCGSNLNCQGLFVKPGDTFYVNLENKSQNVNVVGDLTFQNYLPAVSNYTFEFVNNCIPNTALQITIPLNSVPGSSFQIEAQNTLYDPPQPPYSATIPIPIRIYVGGQKPMYTSALSEFTVCPEAIDTSSSDVSVHSHEKALEILVYPNPASSIISIKLADGSVSTEKYSIKIVDVVSREILTEKYKEKIDISHLEKGIYFLSLYQNNQLIGMKKVVKD